MPEGMDGDLTSWATLGSPAGNAGLLAMHKEALLGPGASPEKATIYSVVDESIDQQEKQIKVRHK